MRTLFLGATTTLLACIPAALAGGGVFDSSYVSSGTAAWRARQIQAAFSANLDAYLKYAWPGDELYALTSNGSGPAANLYGDWGASAVDAISTALVMGQSAQADRLIDLALRIDFTTTRQAKISLFETNIRYVGGLISAYELDGARHFGLINQAATIADKLLGGWIEGQDIPWNSLLHWNESVSVYKPDGQGIAQAGTIVLEWSKLSQYTGNATYEQYARKAMGAIIGSKQLMHPRPKGFFGQNISPANNSALDSYMTWGGGSDSFFEYLIKASYLWGNSSSDYTDTWIETVESSVGVLGTLPDDHADLLFLADYDPSQGGVIPVGSHLACFLGGNWILGGKILGSTSTLAYGLHLTESCAETYRRTPTGLGPEIFTYRLANGSSHVSGSPLNASEYNAWGFSVAMPDYVLRPEVLESVFYAWRATFDPKWQDIAWDAFQAIEKYCKPANGATAGLVGINDVRAPRTAGGQINEEQSFAYAELYKYLYLIFSDASVADLNSVVLNTEGHPLKLQKFGFKTRPISLPPIGSQVPDTAHSFAPGRGGSGTRPLGPLVSALPHNPGGTAYPLALQGLTTDAHGRDTFAHGPAFDLTLPQSHRRWRRAHSGGAHR